jgi:hypothetical protein
MSSCPGIWSRAGVSDLQSRCRRCIVNVAQRAAASCVKSRHGSAPVHGLLVATVGKDVPIVDVTILVNVALGKYL